jgi:hypothetical protein
MCHHNSSHFPVHHHTGHKSSVEQYVLSEILLRISCSMQVAGINSKVLWSIYYMKSSVVWDITLCSPLKVKRHFEETFHLHVQGWRVWDKQEIRQLAAVYFMLVLCLAYPVTLTVEMTCSFETAPRQIKSLELGCIVTEQGGNSVSALVSTQQYSRQKYMPLRHVQRRT